MIVVDNASTMTRCESPGAQRAANSVVRLARNAGYAAGFNAGVAALDGREPDAVLLINPDCRLPAGDLG